MEEIRERGRGKTGSRQVGVLSMYAFNQDTGQYERLYFSGFLAELKRRSQVLKSTQSAEESFVAGGDFQDMAEAQWRKCDSQAGHNQYKAEKEDCSWQKVKREEVLEGPRK